MRGSCAAGARRSTVSVRRRWRRRKFRGVAESKCATAREVHEEAGEPFNGTTRRTVSPKADLPRLGRMLASSVLRGRRLKEAAELVAAERRRAFRSRNWTGNAVIRRTTFSARAAVPREKDIETAEGTGTIERPGMTTQVRLADGRSSRCATGSSSGLPALYGRRHRRRLRGAVLPIHEGRGAVAVGEVADQGPVRGNRRAGEEAGRRVFRRKGNGEWRGEERPRSSDTRSRGRERPPRGCVPSRSPFPFPAQPPSTPRQEINILHALRQLSRSDPPG